MIDPQEVQAVVDDMGKVWASDATPEGVKTWLADLAGRLLATRDPLPGYNKGDPLPQTLGAIANSYADVREMRLAIEKSAGTVKERETELYKVALGMLAESSDTGASGERYRVQKVKKTVQNVEDWPSFHAWIRENDAFEMLQKRLSDKAVKDYRDEHGALPAGVKDTELDTLSFTKV